MLTDAEKYTYDIAPDSIITIGGYATRPHKWVPRAGLEPAQP